ncbi:MAG: hypothetical protein ACE5ID_03640 [Acidobacteriota bacterium]
MNPIDAADAGHPALCRHCTAEFDLLGAVWCSCSASRPTKLCPFCLRCICSLGPTHVEAFWQAAPATLQAERETLKNRRMLLGDMLVASGRITTPQLIQALREQAKSGERLGACLVRMGVLQAEELTRLLDRQHAPITLELEDKIVDGSLAQAVGVDFCLAHRLLPVEKDVLGGRTAVLVAMANPSDLQAREVLARRLGASIIVGISSERTILTRLGEMFPAGTGQAGFGETGREPLILELISQAIANRASLLQLDLTPSISRLSYEVDGFLYRVQGTAGQIDSRHVDGLVEWFGESRHRMLIMDGEHWSLELRLSRTDAATSLRVRIRNASILSERLPARCMLPSSMALLRQEMGRSTGLVILAGPARSDGERAFWGLVNLVACRQRPAEISGSSLCPDSPFIFKTGSVLGIPEEAVLFSYKTGRSRWPELLDMASRRLVVMDVRVRRAERAVVAMIRRGMDASVLRSRLRLLASHRTVRRICEACRTSFTASPEVLAQAGLIITRSTDLNLYKGGGCPECRISPGFKGTELLMAVLEGGELTFRHLDGGFPESGLESSVEASMERQFRTACLGLLRHGLTTLEEFQRSGELAGMDGRRLGSAQLAWAGGRN